MAREARLRGCDGVVCGHIHKAEIREIDGLIYCNDGDWVESLTALVETHTGELKIIHWPHIKGEPVESTEISFQPAVESLLKEAVS
jgi:UDP-2,3-diacylglucosamine pyrophosphatase LpxH